MADSGMMPALLTSTSMRPWRLLGAGDEGLDILDVREVERLRISGIAEFLSKRLKPVDPTGAENHGVAGGREHARDARADAAAGAGDQDDFGVHMK